MKIVDEKLEWRKYVWQAAVCEGSEDRSWGVGDAVPLPRASVRLQRSDVLRVFCDFYSESRATDREDLCVTFVVFLC